MGGDTPRRASAVDAYFAFGLSAAFDGATRVGLSADLVLSDSARTLRRTDLRVGAIRAGADLLLRLPARSRPQPAGFDDGRTEFRIWRSDGGNVELPRLFQQRGNVYAADVCRSRAGPVELASFLYSRRTDGFW